MIPDSCLLFWYIKYVGPSISLQRYLQAPSARVQVVSPPSLFPIVI